MSTDYPAAEEHFVPRNFMFNTNGHAAIVIHKTGGDATPQAVYNTFINSGNPGKSAHYAIGQDGSIWQFVPEGLGAGANGIPDNTMQSFWQPYIQEYGNLNECTLSIEHCDPSSRNDTPLTPAQKQASFALVAHLCQKYGIPASHIKPHNSICATDCPGNYPLQELQDFIQAGDIMQSYTPQSADFNQWFEAQDADHWRCKHNGHIVQYGIKGFFSQLSIDGNSLPVVGLPITNEIYLTLAPGKQVVLQVFERAGIYYDPAHLKDHQPGTGDYSLCHLTDPDFLKHVPGLALPTQPPTPTVNLSDVAAQLHTIQTAASAALTDLSGGSV